VFCPVCKFEYRDGFTKCSDCGADLVERLPENNPSNQPAIAASELLWSGDSSLIANIVGEFLEASEIRFDDEEVEFAKLRRTGLPPVFKIWISPADHEAAHKSLNEALRYIEEQDRLEADREEADAASADSRQNDSVEFNLEDFNLDEATHQVWSGADSDLKEMIVASLQGIGIGCVADEADGNFTLRVDPTAETRAKEIVREIVEQTPPE
jgi:hypothetical protein